MIRARSVVDDVAPNEAEVRFEYSGSSGEEDEGGVDAARGTQMMLTKIGENDLNQFIQHMPESELWL
jgi:hypothetical protein